MTPLQLSIKFMDIVFYSKDYNQLKKICADDMQFEGPFYHFSSSDDYIKALQKDPPSAFTYKILKTFVDETSACLVYEFAKPGISTKMIQVFEIEIDRIKKILIVFDTRTFSK